MKTLSASLKARVRLTSPVLGDGQMSFYQADSKIISLYDRAKLTAEEDLSLVNGPLNVHSGINLAQNQKTNRMEKTWSWALSATRRKPANTFRGDYTGSFSYSNGHVR
jgi:hypothetical protein